MIGDKDLVMHTKFKHPGSVKSDTVTMNITAANIANGAARVTKIVIPMDETPFASAQVYLEDPFTPGAWLRTPDTASYTSDFLPISVAGIITPTALEITAVQRNSFGSTVAAVATTLKLKYFLFK